MKSVKTLLINPPVSVEALYGKFSKGGSNQPPLSLCYLASYLLKHNKEVRILDAAKLNLDSDGIKKAISEYEPNIIGFHTCTPYIKTVKTLAAEIKSQWPQILVIAGGPHFLGNPLEDIKDSFVDIIVIGEGEQTCLEIVEGLEQYNSVELLLNYAKQIKGILYKQNGERKTNPSRELIQDIDSLPMPARHLLPPLTTYKLSAANYRRLPATAMLTSRGCPFQCIFCVNSTTKEKVRFFSVDYVTREVDQLIENYKVKEIAFIDDVFTVDKKRTYQICERLAQRKNKLIWSCNIKVRLVDKKLLKVMKDSGCWMVMVGIESGNQEILNRIKKQFTLQEAEELCNWCKEVGLVVHPNFILGHPGETQETLNQTISFAKKLYCHYPLFTLMVPYPGTELWNQAKQYGKLKTDNFDVYTLGNENPCFIPYGLTEEILIKKRNEAYRKCYLNLSMVKRHLRTIKTFEDIKRLFSALKIISKL